ncbi:MAG: non-homologous end-joining DNA ligase [Actinobacteria bacterium]|nr:non-homologous end-joining DNA ligase [Actinomycetota bacterium]
MRLPDYRPMLATPWPKPFDDEDWWFEIKWDGYRAIVSSEMGRVRARSRRGLDLLGRFPELAGLEVPDGVVLDGEVVAFDEAGRPSFSALQTGVPVNLVVFDVLFHGAEVTQLSYVERRALLDRLGLAAPMIVPEPTPTHGVGLYEAARAQGLEGVVGKRMGSVYLPGRRSPDWRKISVRRRIRAVIGGYLPGEGSRAATFGSVLVGLNGVDGLRWVGAVGSGFDEGSLVAFNEALRQIVRPTSPFVDKVRVPSTPTWVEPVIVIEVEYKEWTHDHHLRAPVYKGVDDTPAEEVTWESEGAP